MTIPVDTGTDAGALVDRAGQVQFGPMLLGGGTSAGWVNLTGWRDLPGIDLGDSLRPHTHGEDPGSVYAQSLFVTFDLLLRGMPDDKHVDLALLERHTRAAEHEQPLVVDDGAGPTMRMARVVARSIPMDKTFRLAPLACSVQWKCTDPRRYSLTEQTVDLALAASSGGLTYPLDYPLDYGTSSSGSATATNAGSEDSPLTVVFTGPLTNPGLAGPGWLFTFDLELAAGEQLTVDTRAGTVLLGDADRLHTLTATSSPLDACTIPAGDNTLTLVGAAGIGTASVTFRDAYL